MKLRIEVKFTHASEKTFASIFRDIRVLMIPTIASYLKDNCGKTAPQLSYCRYRTVHRISAHFCQTTRRHIPKAVHRHRRKILNKCTDVAMMMMFISTATDAAGKSRN